MAIQEKGRTMIHISVIGTGNILLIGFIVLIVALIWYSIKKYKKGQH